MGLGEGARSSSPTNTKCKLASQAGKLEIEIVGHPRKRGTAVEGVPSWARCPLPLAGASWRPVLPCISGGGGEARCDGWVASRVAARPSLRRSLPRAPPSFCLVPLTTAKG